MRIAFSIIIFAFLLFANSCEYACSKASLQFGLVGFTDQEADTIIIRQFLKSGVVKDSFLLQIQFQRNNDTLNMTAFPGTAVLDPSYNYEIFFPETDKMYRLTDIIEEQLFRKSRGKTGCINNISGYTLDGQLRRDISPFNTTYLTH